MKHFLTIMLILITTAAGAREFKFTALRAVSSFNDLM